MEILFNDPKKNKTSWDVAKIINLDNRIEYIASYRESNYGSYAYTIQWQRKPFVFSATIELIAVGSLSGRVSLLDKPENAEFTMRVRHFNRLITLCKQGAESFRCDGLIFHGRFTFNRTSGLNIEPYITET